MSVYRESVCRLVALLGRSPVVAEIGVHRGRTSEALLRRFPGLTLHMVDPWAEWRDPYQPDTSQTAQDEFYAEAIRRTAQWSSRRRIHRLTSQEAALVVPACDLAFIDGEHSYEACSLDIALWWPKVAGVLCGHDHNEKFPGVVRAVREFCDREQVAAEVMEGDVWWVRKN